MRHVPIHLATLISASLCLLLPDGNIAAAASSGVTTDLSAQLVQNQKRRPGAAAPASSPAPRAVGPRQAPRTVAPRRGPASGLAGPRRASPRVVGPGPRPGSAPRRAVGPRPGPAPRRVVGPRPGPQPGAGLRNVSPVRRGPPRVVTFTGPRVVNGGRLRGISARGPATTVIRGQNFSAWRNGYRIRYRNRWRTFVALGALGAIAVGTVTYYPYAYLSAPRPFCDGLTEDGCQMMWQDVETIEGDVISQCVAYCPWQE